MLGAWRPKLSAFLGGVSFGLKQGASPQGGEPVCKTPTLLLSYGPLPANPTSSRILAAGASTLQKEALVRMVLLDIISCIGGFPGLGQPPILLIGNHAEDYAAHALALPLDF